jgi:hypothetical protein
MHAVVWAGAFLVINVLVVEIIIRLKQRQRDQPRVVPALEPAVARPMKAEEILEWEYEYVRNTASEAMQDRHTMINFYLVLVGVVASGVVANLDKLDKWQGGATLLLWVVCGIGWFHFLILVRLREAWHESLQALQWIRDFCVEHADDISSDELRKAFLWRRETLPRAGKRWSVFYYSALLIAFLDSVAFGVGGHLLNLGKDVVTLPGTAVLVVLSILFFAYHDRVYGKLLKEKP